MENTDVRQDLIACGQQLVAHRLIQATWGNVSVRVDDEHFLITPSGVDYARVTPEDIVLVSISDGSYEKGARPSSERRMHRAIYEARPDIKAIVHTHSANCGVFAACRQGLVTDEVNYPCAEYAVSGSSKLAKNVRNIMLAHDGCIMANHGFVTGAQTLAEAFAQARDAEQIAGEVLGA